MKTRTCKAVAVLLGACILTMGALLPTAGADESSPDIDQVSEITVESVIETAAATKTSSGDLPELGEAGGGVSALVYCVWTPDGSNCMEFTGMSCCHLGIDSGVPQTHGSSGHICIDN